ncbi:putative aspartate racemase FomE protein [Micromonospora lupini str. Lupac 08]|uniref:Putative aspartate racemase FomE protein n=1 Tax=Micromonospora lupini str. Lupac 08 TaxID=1150864 RepID=I0L9R7_9ACTN|nr:putative aspartate racemase FomE protein [Micromonospora lupini str. Lupac 08]
MDIRRLGVVGGVGPLAVAHFYQRLIQLTPAVEDDEHLEVVLVAERVPSRIAYLRGVGPSPVPALLRAAKHLEAAGVDALVIPSATTHAFRDDVARAVAVPVLDLLAEVGAVLAGRGFRRPVFLATAPTARLRLYEPHLQAGTRPLYPSAPAQRRVDALIDGVKRGEPVEALRAGLTELIAAGPWPIGADCVVLACTELPVIAPRGGAGPLPLVDVTEVLAHAVLARRLMPARR